MTAAVQVVDVSKRFRLYHEKYMTLKERVIHFGNLPYDEFAALEDVSMEISEGETLGLMGHNGSGKSTLLKCIAGILRPTKGHIRVRGQLAAMLELGAGFNPELSGRDNIYLNATLLGMSRREIDRRFDEIVAFSELERFIDNQVKFYSSGMYAKLGFAVAVSFEPDILLVDEVLAVGDERFQAKCLDRIRSFQAQGRTIVLVSHAPDLVRLTCQRAFVLHHGKLVYGGASDEAVRIFRERLFSMDTSSAAEPTLEEEGLALGSIVSLGAPELDYAGAGERPYLFPGERLVVNLPYQGHRPEAEQVVFSLAMHDRAGRLVYGTNTETSGIGVIDARGEGTVCFQFDEIPLLDGTYKLSFRVTSPQGGRVYDLSEQKAQFDVMNRGRDTGSVAMGVQVSLGPATPLAAGGLSV